MCLGPAIQWKYLQYPITNDGRLMTQYIFEYATMFLLHNFDGIEQLKSGIV